MTGLPESPNLTRREYAIKISGNALVRANQIIQQWKPDEGETDVQFSERCINFIATVTINAFTTVMDGGLDDVALVKNQESIQ
jgi:hypothetical protein